MGEHQRLAAGRLRHAGRRAAGPGRLGVSGFILPAPTRGAIDAREVHHFHADDLAAAGEVARAAERIPGEMGVRDRDVAIRDLMARPGVEPRPSKVEIGRAVPQARAIPPEAG